MKSINKNQAKTKFMLYTVRIGLAAHFCMRTYCDDKNANPHVPGPVCTPEVNDNGCNLISACV